ncbi:MAG: type II secretion system minor pseudopilin GspI [Pseudomonadota bacterium]|nr:type II secretion system minor pseudopilin GspI [Pseudomonadota bacterium]
MSRGGRARRGDAAGFTLVEVLVALMVVAMGLAALMVAVSSTARTSGYLRDKTLAQWIALNRLSEVRLNLSSKFGQNTDTGELNFAGRRWHYDTRYFNTSYASMRHVVVRVYAGDAKTKGSPLVESSGFTGTTLSQPGSTTVDWNQGNTATSTSGTSTTGTSTTGTSTSGTSTTGTSTTGTSTSGTSTSGTSTTSTTGTSTTAQPNTAPATGQTSAQ